MPAPKRRRTAGPATQANAQKTLSFRSTKAGAASGKVTKPDAQSASAKQVKSGSERQAIAQEVQKQSDIETADEEVEESGDTQVAALAEEDAEEKALDSRALALPENDLKKYWTAKEKERKSPRVHQESLTTREKILREFDMTSRYGPSIGITRLARWRRANMLDLSPPIEVLAVLLKTERDIEEQDSKAGKGAKPPARRRSLQKSILDELILSSRGEVGEDSVAV